THGRGALGRQHRPAAADARDPPRHGVRRALPRLHRTDPRRARGAGHPAGRARRGPGQRARCGARADLGLTPPRRGGGHPAAGDTGPAARRAGAGEAAGPWVRRGVIDSAGVGHGVDDLDLERLAVGGEVADGVTLAGTGDGRTERRLGGVDREAGTGLELAGGEQELLGLVLVVADEAVGDLHAGLDHTVVGRGLADLGAPEGVLELEDAPLELALLLAGGVVAAVLHEVALLARRADALHDLGALGALELLELGDELVVAVAGQPDGLRRRLGHG